MAPGFLSRTCPVELLFEIFKQLPSTQDALSFALTCRHINDVWDRNATSILLALWRRNGEFPAVEEALIAARMTKVVVEAEQADSLPPTDMRPGDFSINHGGAPTVSELKAARALHHLARALSVAFCHHNAYLPERRVFKGPPERTPAQASRMPEWSARVHKAIYRTMIAGAALAGIYNEPLFKAKTHSDARIRRLARVKEQSEEPDDLFYGDGALALEEFFAFLHDFPVCRITLPPETEEQLFGPLAAWLVNNILSDKQGREAMAKRLAGGYPRANILQYLARVQQPHQECLLTSVEGGLDHSDAHLVLWEVMQIAWAFHHILGTLEYEQEEVQSGLEGSATVEAVAVFFGAFKTQQIIVPKHVDSFLELPIFRSRFMNCGGVARTYRISSRRSNPFPSEPHSYQGCWSWNCSSLNTSSSSNTLGLTVTSHFEMIYQGSRQPNCWVKPGVDEYGDECEYDNYATPLLIKFFQYTLERHLRVTFIPNIFYHNHHAEWEHEPFSVFLLKLAIFAHDEDLLNLCTGGTNSMTTVVHGEELVERFNGRRSLLVYRPNEEWQIHEEILNQLLSFNTWRVVGASERCVYLNGVQENLVEMEALLW